MVNVVGKIPSFPTPPPSGPKTEESYQQLFVRVVELLTKIGFDTSKFNLVEACNKFEPEDWYEMNLVERDRCVRSGEYILPKLLAPGDRRLAVPYFELSLVRHTDPVLLNSCDIVKVYLTEEQIVKYAIEFWYVPMISTQLMNSAENSLQYRNPILSHYNPSPTVLVRATF